ncbi:MAG: HEAT repeat domain-containing protein [Pirellulaceae bacterium]
METNHKFTDLLRLLADSHAHPDPESSPLSSITDLGDQAVPSLIEALTHDDPVIRRTAAETLGQLKSPFEDRVDLQPAVPHLETMMASDPDTLIRLHAAEAIWIITKDKKVVPGFIEALSDKDVEVRRFAVSMIGLVEADLQDVIQPLIAALADSNPFVRGTAAMVVADYGQKAAEVLPHLERLLADDEFNRVTAVHAILCIDASRIEELTPHLTEALSSEDKTVRHHAAQILGDTPAAGALAIQSLVQALGDEDDTVRLIVLNTLNNLGTAAAPATPALIKILTDNNDIIERGFAALALGSIGPAAEEAVPQLLRCLQEPGDSAARVYCRLKIADALWQISGAAEHLLAIGLEAVRRSEHWLRWHGAGLLGELGAAGSEAIPQLRSLLDDEHQLVRRSAAESLAKIEAT